MRIGILIVVILAVVAMPMEPVMAFDAGDIQLNLTLSPQRSCQVQAILDQFNSLFDTMKANVINALMEEFTFTNQLLLLKQKLDAKIFNWTAFGTGGPGSVSVVYSGGGKIESILQTQWKQSQKQKFLDACIAASTMNQIDASMSRIMNENGRDGGPVWIQSWTDFQTKSQYRGIQIARNNMAQTNFCPWVRSDMQSVFNYNPADAVGVGGSSPTDLCTMPTGSNPFDPAQQNAAMLAALTLPENNIYGSYLHGISEIQASVEQQAKADEYEYVYSGGIGALRAQNPQTGDSCLVYDKTGTCLRYSAITQPAGGLQSQGAAVDLAKLLNILEHSGEVDSDYSTQIAQSFLSRAQPPISFQFRIGLGFSGSSSSPSPTPTPSQTPPSTNPVCGNIPSGCACAADTGDGQSIAQLAVMPAEQAVVSAHQTSGDLVTSDGSGVLPGQNIPFLQAVCDQTSMAAYNCRPRAGSQNEIVINVTGIEMSINIITSTGVIRMPGQAIAACPAGSL